MQIEETNQRRSYSINKLNKGLFAIEDIDEPNFSRNNSSSKAEIFGKKKDKFKTCYTTICQKFYPLILKLNIYESYQKFPYFCLTCNNHLFNKGQNKHKYHSIISLKNLEISDEDIINTEKTIDKNMDNIFKCITSQEKANNDPKLELQKQNDLINLKNQLKNFNHFVIEQYKNNKYNFYNFFNFYYLFKLKDDIKKGKNDLLRMFFSIHSYKKLCHRILYYLESKKKIWLLKHIIGYKKNEINKVKLKLRKKRYNFDTLDVLLKDENFDNSMINKMSEIIKEVKEREDLKNKIFNFMIQSVDIFKEYPQKFEKELDVILKQVKINFKKMVKNAVGDTEDVKKFMKQKESSYYYSNNYKNNRRVYNYKENEQNNVYKYKCKTNIVNEEKKSNKNKEKKEIELYNDFEVKKYEPEYQSITLDIGNIFIANNNNNNYYEDNTDYTSINNTYENTVINNIICSEYDEEKKKPKKKDILGCLSNLHTNNKTKYTVEIDTSNIIKANNNNNNIKKSNNIKVYENNKIKEKTVINYHLKEKKSKKIEESKNSEISKIDILQKEIKKKDNSNKKKDNLYTTNYKFDINIVNNDNNQKIETNYENRVTNCDIKINNEINIYNKSQVQCKDENIEIKYEEKNENNDKEIKKDEKLIIYNKKVDIDTKEKITIGNLVNINEIEQKIEIKDKEKNKESMSKEELNTKKKRR